MRGRAAEGRLPWPRGAVTVAPWGCLCGAVARAAAGGAGAVSRMPMRLDSQAVCMVEGDSVVICECGLGKWGG